MKNTKKSDNIAKDKSQKVLMIQRIGVICFSALAIGAFIFAYFKYGTRLYEIFGSSENIEKFLAKYGGYDRAVFVLIRAFQTVIKIIPAEPLEIGSGYLYGVWGGLFYCLLGTEIGSLVIIALTKFFGKRMVELFVPLDKIKLFKIFDDPKKSYFTLFIIYLIPGTPKDIITYIAGLTNINMPMFLLVTGIARIPSIITSTWCGEKLVNRDYKAAIIIFAITIIITFICAAVYKKIASKSEKNSKDETESEEQQN